MYGASRDHYRSQAVETAGPAQLVLMLYDAALGAVGRAEKLLEDRPPGYIEASNEHLKHAQDIVTELRVTLDRERGGHIATHLEQLYDFCLDRLLDANLRKDPADLAPVHSILGGLRDGWASACCGDVLPSAG